MRKSLEPYLGNEIIIIATVSKIEGDDNKKNSKRIESQNRVLLTKIINKENNEFLSDHLWYPKSKFNSLESLSVGDIVEIKGKVLVYLRALYNNHVSNKFNYYIDFELNNIKKVGIQQEDEKKVEFYTDTCKSKVRAGYYFTIANLKKIHNTLETKEYLYTKFLKDIIRSRLLYNPNYESILIINSSGSIYTKNKKYKDNIDLKTNEITLCRIGKQIFRVGKIYRDYAELLEKQGIYESFNIIDMWDNLPKNDRNKIKIISSNLEYISQPYIVSVEKLKRYIELEIQYNCNKDSKIKRNKVGHIEDSIVIKTPLVKSRVSKNYYFEKNDLDIIYQNLIKKRFHIMMKIFNKVKGHLNNNIDYDNILVVNNVGKIYFIKVDRDNIDISNYLEQSEIEICRFGKKVIKKSNIYHDYVEILKQEYDNLDDLDIWSLWYKLDNENITKKDIMEKNFQTRKKGYVNQYDVLLKGIAKEIEIQKMY